MRSLVMTLAGAALDFLVLARRALALGMRRPDDGSGHALGGVLGGRRRRRLGQSGALGHLGARLALIGTAPPTAGRDDAPGPARAGRIAGGHAGLTGDLLVRGNLVGQ